MARVDGYNDELERVSGIPPRGKLGESRKELWALLAAGGALIVIALAFLIEATP